MLEKQQTRSAKMMEHATTIGRGGAPGCLALLIAAGLLSGPAAAQANPGADTLTREQGGTGSAARVAEAVRVTAAPEIDGVLDEAMWASAPVLGGFVQREPEEGALAEDRTEVRFAYDEQALYIGARMYGDPAVIRTDMTRRDDEGGAERLVVSLDTYRDRRTAYTFAVTAAGVRIDYYQGSDREGDEDFSFDPVWTARTQVDSRGWTAEIRIPFTQLRFNPGHAQTWGVNVVRVRPALQERAYWVLVGREETGWASRMGDLRGISGVAPSRRIELQPYVASSARMVSGVDADDPFAEETEVAFRVGGDLKMGLGPNLTLDATFNPDFGQVEADPAVVNLSAFEVFFDERRPFFTEGSQLFDVGSLFYSRRIGAPPHGDADADYVESLDNTTILGAAKLTGRLPSGLSIGVLSALTQEETVSTYSETTNAFEDVAVEPLTAYGVVSMDQQFGANGSNVGFIVTGVHRALDGQPELASLLTENALGGAIAGRYRWAGGMYDAHLRLQGTHVSGSEEAILRQQTSSRRYYQRPDAPHVEVDSLRTSLSGYVLSTGASRNSGTHWLWDVDLWAESPGFEPNDLGAHSTTDGYGGFAGLYYRETTPNPLTRRYTVRLMTSQEWNYGESHTSSWYGFNLNGVFANYYYFEIGLDYNPPVLSHSLTRGGPLMRSTGFNGVFAGIETPSGRKLELDLWAGTGNDELGGWSYWVAPEASWRPTPRLELSLEPEYSRSHEPRQYVDDVDGGPDATYGTRYVFSHLDYSELSAQLRLNLAIRPDLTLETYAEPFASSGRYYGFGELARARDNDLRAYGEDGTTIAHVRTDTEDHYVVTDGAESFTIGNPDFRAMSFRSNVVLRWEWRPGSTLFLVWQQDRSGGGLPNRSVRPGDLGDAFSAAGDNFLAVKATYWLPL
ncbi:MAG TPA: DUF5916 domain-containing protein [Longimicrobiales bacterium]|nr:DUF5916 domain-containing protein [Longimicrobiales bacterium]